ncbi:membrane protein insertase YidC [Staphylococcus cohnii]|uniref:membrane protein insertase YidC n=1 Tax=Staphylococcus cohnii TaxID=29382 RepID=UPI000E693D54|nr:membrane protein insertase YidC [Staphylococcus cohnii]RIL72749.1 membrane protein insertase YidC [Staphylococcus cohnii]
MNKKWIVLIFLPLILTACDYSKQEDRNGLFYYIFVKPIDMFLHGLGQLFGNNYGLAIIMIVLTIRLILMPFMLIQVKNMHLMREKTKIVQPQIDNIKQRVSDAQTQEEKREANKALMTIYKRYDINPIKSVIGCLPILIQLPILFGLIVTLKFPSSGGIDQFPHFLWFNLTKPDLWISLIAAVIYFIQPLVNAMHYPKNQRKTYYIMMILSPIFITYISLHSAAALGLYWTFSGLFLIIQMHFAHSYYSKQAKQEALKLEHSLDKANTELNN